MAFWNTIHSFPTIPLRPFCSKDRLENKNRNSLPYPRSRQPFFPPFSPRRPFCTKGRMEQQGWEKLGYIVRQFFAELGLSQWRSRQFWAMVILLLVIFWIRLYIHYIGQWMFLSAISIPINQ